MGDIADYHVDQFASGRWGTPTKKEFDNMVGQSYQTRIVTEEVRFSYVNLLTPRQNSNNPNEAAKFSVTILLPKTDVATKQRIDAAIEQAKLKGQADKWRGVIPPMVDTPVRDGDAGRPSDGMPFGEECKGHWVINASTNQEHPPKIVDLNTNPIIDPTEVYSGMYGKIAINFSPYDFAGKKGISAYISTNVQKTRDGEPLGGAAPAAIDDFGAGLPPAPQTYQQQPPTQAGWTPQAAPAPQAPNTYQPPVQQTAPNAGQAPQFDPITGQPINTGYGNQ